MDGRFAHVLVGVIEQPKHRFDRALVAQPRQRLAGGFAHRPVLVGEDGQQRFDGGRVASLAESGGGDRPDIFDGVFEGLDQAGDNLRVVEPIQCIDGRDSDVRVRVADCGQ